MSCHTIGHAMGTTNAVEAPKEEIQETPKEDHNDNYVSYKWVNITAEFFDATRGLELGELIHDEIFGLFEAMSAIEMMDPKMDAGMVCNRGSFKPGKLKLKEINTSEKIGIMDCTWACLVTWLEGHSLSQTVFTNLYLHKPYDIEDRCIRAFSIGILKLVAIINEFVSKACVYEEEDFQLVVHGYKLAPEVSEMRACGMLREVEEEYFKKVKATRSKQGEPWDAKTQQLHELATALHSRVKFLRMLYQAILSFNRKECTGVPDAERFLTICLELIENIQKTVDKGVQPEQTGNTDYPTIMGFDPLVNQRRLPPTFPRYTRIKSREETMVYLEELVKRLRTACEIVDLTNFHHALDFFLDFSRGSPCVISRSIPQLLYLQSCNKVFGMTDFTEVLRDSCKSFTFPPALSPKSSLLNNQQCRSCVDTFFNLCVCPFASYILICGHNAARQRNKIAHLLEEFANLQGEADNVDAFLHKTSMKTDNPRPHLACFTTWILYHILRIMIQYLLSGFELELYSIHEYHYIYWYLYEFLYGWLASALTRADSFILEQDQTPETGRGRSHKKIKSRKKKPHPYGKEIAVNQGLQNLCAGLYKIMIGFKIDKKIPKPNPEFDNEEVRYEHRFAPFANIGTPPPVPYSHFRDATNVFNSDKSPPSEELYMSACKNFHQAKCYFEAITNPTPKVESLLKVAKTNFVVGKLLIGGHKKDSLEVPQFDFSVHPNFPIIKLP